MAKGLALLFPEKDLERIIWKTVVWANGRSRDEKEGGYLPARGDGGRMEMLVPTAEGCELEASFCSTWDLLEMSPHIRIVGARGVQDTTRNGTEPTNPGL